MELFLSNQLPKDLIYIIQDYAKDRKKYDRVIAELNFAYSFGRKKALIPSKMSSRGKMRAKGLAKLRTIRQFEGPI